MLIGEVAQRSGVSVRMLRHYDKLGLVTPSHRSTTGYREYSDGDLRRLFHVESLRSLGMSLAQAATALDDPDFAAADTIAEMSAALKQRVTQEQALLERLAGIERVIRAGNTAPDSTRPNSSPPNPTGATATTPAAAEAPGEDLLEAIALFNILRSGDSYKRQAAALRVGSQSQLAAPTDDLARAYLDEPDENSAGALLWALTESAQTTAANPNSAGASETTAGETSAGDSNASDAIAQLAAAAGHPDPARRARAVRGLAGLGSGAMSAIGTFLHDPDSEVAALAALTLGRAGVPEALPGLVAAIVAGQKDVEAAEVAAAVDPTAALALLRAELAKSPEPGARRRLVQALGEFPAELTRDLLEALRADPDTGIARTAAHLLAVAAQPAEPVRRDIRRGRVMRPGRAPSP